MRSIIRTLCSFAVLSAVGCVVPSPVNIVAPAAAGADGVVMSGPQPVANATIQLYTVGNMGDGSVATSLLTTAITTDAKGSFSIQGMYSCTGASEVYLTATGGNPLIGVVNPNLAMMTAIGPCSSLNPGTPVVVNELTTVAAVNALAPFMTSYAGIGSSLGDVASLQAAFTLASEMVNPATGTSPGLNVQNGESVPTEAIDTLGNVVVPCINSGGGTAGGNSPCGILFSLVAPFGVSQPSNTIDALLDLAKNPGLDTGALYQLISPNAPFQPQLSVVPSNFSISVSSVAVAPLEVSKTSVNFPPTPIGSTSQAQSVTLTNPATTAISVFSVVIGGEHPSDFAETNDCPGNLPGGGFCTIQIALSPQSTPTQTATLEINDGQIIVALSGTGTAPGWPAALVAANPSLYLDFNDTTTSFLDHISGLTFTSGGGSVSPQAPGFDSTQPSNKSAIFSWDSYSTAPNNTLGDIEWDVPWTMLIHIDQLNWRRTGTLVLASKGDLASTTWWTLTLGMQWGNFSQLCFTRSGAGAENGICTGYFDAMPNGFNYDIVVEDNGSGGIGNQGSVPSALNIYINGLSNPYIPVVPFTNTFANGFGYVNLSVTGGTGYADSTPFTSTGGGTNCSVTGFMASRGGVPYNSNWTPTGSNNYGCISAPTIVLASPTGTGAVVTATLGGASMNSATSPLMVPGYMSAGKPYGAAGTDSTANVISVDEFAIFPASLSQTQISNIFSQTKFYQGLLNPVHNPPPIMLFDDDGCRDLDNGFALQMAIALHQQGILSLAGVVSEDGSVTCEALWRQILDQAGLNKIPLAVPTTFWSNSGTFEPTSNITAYDPSTPLSNAAWGPSTSMYRTIFSTSPKSPIDIVLGGPFTAMAEFMASPADSISPLTGLELMAQNAANGGAIYAQGLGCPPASLPATTPCSGSATGDNSLDDPVSGDYVVANNGATPIYWMGGTPQMAGPGELLTRTGNDPMLLFLQTVGADTRSCWDCMAVAAAVTSYFTGGSQVGFSGGSGYAASTQFSFGGGGQNCEGYGIMTATGGVPNGIEFLWGTSAVGSSTGIGWGCTSAPTVHLIGATGTGVTLTAYPTSVCATYTITGNIGSTSSKTCSNHYFEPYSSYTNQTPVSGAIFSWFINSLIDATP